MAIVYWRLNWGLDDDLDSDFVHYTLQAASQPKQQNPTGHYLATTNSAPLPIQFSLQKYKCSHCEEETNRANFNIENTKKEKVVFCCNCFYNMLITLSSFIKEKDKSHCICDLKTLMSRGCRCQKEKK